MQHHQAKPLSLFINWLVWLWLPLVCLAADDFDAFLQQLDELKTEQQQLEFSEQQQAELDQWTLLDQAKFWHRKGLVLEVNDQIEAAKQAFTTGIQLFEENNIPDPTWVQSWQDLSYMKYLQTNDPEVYCPDRQQALKLARVLNDPAVLASSLTQMAYCYQQDFADFSQGLAQLNEAAGIASEHGLSANLTAVIHNATGNLYRSAKVADKAYDYYQRALRHWLVLEDHQDVYNMRHNLVGESINLVNWQQAEQHIAELHEMARQLPEFRDFTFFAYFNAARTEYAKQEFESALQQIDHALELAHTTSEQYFIDQLRAKKIISLFRLGRMDEARSLTGEYLKTAPTVYSFKSLNIRVQAIHEQLNGQPDDSIKTLWVMLDEQNQNQRSFISNAVAAQTAAFDRTLRTFQNQAEAEKKQAETEKQLALKELQLERQTSRNKINQLTLLVAVLVALVLLVLTWMLYRSGRNYQRMSQTDVLTHQANRRHIINQARHHFEQLDSHRSTLTLAIIDIDDFKQINDEFGHATGDQVIIALADCVSQHISQPQQFGRIGGEEFMLVFPGQNKQQVVGVLHAILQAVAGLQVDQGASFTISAGCAEVNAQDGSLEELMKRADQALYHAKSAGKNQISKEA